MKYNKTTIIIVSIFIIGIVFWIAILQLNSISDSVTYIQCCNGNMCSDTYYTSEDNLCHLTLCESSPISNKEDCTYEGENKTIELINVNKGEK